MCSCEQEKLAQLISSQLTVCRKQKNRALVSTSGPVCVRFEARKTSEVRNVKPVSVRLHSLTGRPKRMFELTALLVRDMGVGVTRGGEGRRGEGKGGEGRPGERGRGGEGR